MASSIPAVLMERLTDVVAVVLLGLVGLALLPESILRTLVGVLALSGLLVSKHNDNLFQLPVLRIWMDEIQVSGDGIRSLDTSKPILVAIGFGVLAWLCGGLAFWLILHGLDIDIVALRALPIYASATIAGAITTLPSGLIGTEGTMLALLQESGVAKDVASAVTLLVCLVPLGLAVGLGMIALGVLNRRHSVGIE